MNLDVDAREYVIEGIKQSFSQILTHEMSYVLRNVNEWRSAKFYVELLTEYGLSKQNAVVLQKLKHYNKLCELLNEYKRRITTYMRVFTMKLDEVYGDDMDYIAYDVDVEDFKRIAKHYVESYKVRIRLLRRRIKRFFYLVHEGVSEFLTFSTPASYKESINQLRSYALQIVERLVECDVPEAKLVARKALEELNEIMTYFKKHNGLLDEVLHKDVVRVVRKLRWFVDVVLPTLTSQ